MKSNRLSNMYFNEMTMDISDQINIQEVNCTYSLKHMRVPIDCCLEIHQTILNFLLCNNQSGITSRQPSNDVAVKKLGSIRTGLRNLFVVLWDILFPHSQESFSQGQDSHASSPTTLYKSNGCSIQPMSWNPGNQHGNVNQEINYPPN